MQQYFQDNAVVLFQGDSITDCGRTGENGTLMGCGYPVKVQQIYNALFPHAKVTFVNRAVSGDRVRNLLARYEDDFIAVKPDFVSILIGVNDSWRSADGDPCAIERFTDEYDTLLSKLRADLPETTILLFTPFLLHCDPEKLKWETDLKEKIAVVKTMAEKYHCILLDFEKILWDDLDQDKYTQQAFSADGVHPTDFGQSVMAIEFLKHLGVLG